MGASRSQSRDKAAAQLAAGIASYALGVPIDLILKETRGPAPAAFARQTAMYLCHVGLALSLSRVATAFERDRSTVAHACHLIEDRRDDAGFDAWIGALEDMLREAPKPGAAPAQLESVA